MVGVTSGWPTGHQEPSRGSGLHRWPAGDLWGAASRSGVAHLRGIPHTQAMHSATHRTVGDGETVRGYPPTAQRPSVAGGGKADLGGLQQVEAAILGTARPPQLPHIRPPPAQRGSGWSPGGSGAGQLDRRPAGVLVGKRGSGTRRRARRWAWSRSTVSPICRVEGGGPARFGAQKRANPPTHHHPEIEVDGVDVTQPSWRRYSRSRGRWESAVTTAPPRPLLSGYRSTGNSTRKDTERSVVPPA